jgi:enoyl-CoA hydratase
MADEPVIAWALEGPMARLRIQRAAKRNALATAHWAAIEAALSEIAASKASVLRIEGVPGAFCAGADIEELNATLKDRTQFAANTAVVQRCQLAVQRLPLTTIAVIDGICMGGGLGLALACDFRLASADSRFALTPAKLGLVYSVDDTRRLVHIVGMARARELLLTGRVLDADTAVQWGLLTALYARSSFDIDVQRFIDALHATSASARAGIKRVLAHLGGDMMVTREAADRAFEEAFSSSDFAEGAAAYLEKRTPQF